MFSRRFHVSPQASQVILELESFGLPFSRTPEAPAVSDSSTVLLLYLMVFRGFHEFKGRVIAPSNRSRHPLFFHTCRGQDLSASLWWAKLEVWQRL